MRPCIVLVLLALILTGCERTSSQSAGENKESTRGDSPAPAADPRGEVEKEPIHEGRPLSSWIKQLKDEDARKNLDAIDALGVIGPKAKDAVPALVEIAKDNSSANQLGAAAAICYIAPSEIKPVLPVLSAALYQRFTSRGEDDFATKVLSAMRFEFGGHIEKPAGS